MSTAIIAITYKRVTETAMTWNHNILPKNYLLSSHNPVYWWDNTPDGKERDGLLKIAAFYNIKEAYHDGINHGISKAVNYMAEKIFSHGHTGFITMASDILEPAGWIQERERICQHVPAGIAAIPPAKHHTSVVRYQRQEINGIGYEHGGDIIGNWYVTKEAYYRIGPYPEHYGIYGPIDLEYCARARKAGIKAVYLSDMSAECLECDDDTEYIMNKNRALADAWPIYSNIMSQL